MTDRPGPRPPRPRPGPGPGVPRPGPTPGAPRPVPHPPAPEPPSTVTGSDAASWGRVDADGTVYVRTSEGERAVGQWPGGDPDEALTLYTRRFDGLAVEVDLLERRVRNASLSPDEARSAVAKVRDQVVGAQAVGDLESLVCPARRPGPADRGAARAAQGRQGGTPRRGARREGDPGRRRGAGGGRQRVARRCRPDARADGPLEGAAAAREVGRRCALAALLRARTTYTRRRKQHYSEQHEQRLGAQEVKERLATEAEGLATSTEWGPTAGRFRDLMRRWKEAGPAPHQDEEALWSRFRGAQDTFFSARDAENARTDAEFAANAEVKRAILVDAEALLPVTDLAAARAALRDMGARWEAAGKVPRDQMKELEARMRAVETAVREAEDERWQRSNPEARARAEAAVAQLEASLDKLRADAAKAKAAANDRKLAEAEQAIAARESWLVEAQRRSGRVLLTRDQRLPVARSAAPGCAISGSRLRDQRLPVAHGRISGAYARLWMTPTADDGLLSTLLRWSFIAGGHPFLGSQARDLGLLAAAAAPGTPGGCAATHPPQRLRGRASARLDGPARRGAAPGDAGPRRAVRHHGDVGAVDRRLPAGRTVHAGSAMHRSARDHQGDRSRRPHRRGLPRRGRRHGVRWPAHDDAGPYDRRLSAPAPSAVRALGSRRDGPRGACVASTARRTGRTPPRLSRHRAGTRLANLVDAGIEWPGESWTKLRLVEAGCPIPHAQVKVSRQARPLGVPRPRVRGRQDRLRVRRPRGPHAGRGHRA